MQSPDSKAGWQTSEFWVTAAMQVLSILVLTGAVSSGDRSSLEGVISRGVESAVALITAAVTIWKYVEARQAIKTKAMEATATVMVNQMATEAQMAGAGTVITKTEAS